MAYKTVFETTPIVSISFTGIIILIAFFIILFLGIKYWNRSARIIDKIGPFVIDALLLYCIVCVVYTQIKCTINVYDEYKKGNYQIVTGTVEQFHASSPELHDAEHFCVNDELFTYPDNTGYGYSLCKKDGGYITGNGQKVRIRYINYRGFNIILKLEIVTE